jgi:hypothetical protein
MMHLRIKIDVWSKHLDEHIRAEIRANLQDLYFQFPPRRVWLFLKCKRFMRMRGSPVERALGLGVEADMDGVEDEFVRSMSLPFHYCFFHLAAGVDSWYRKQLASS